MKVERLILAAAAVLTALPVQAADLSFSALAAAPGGYGAPLYSTSDGGPALTSDGGLASTSDAGRVSMTRGSSSQSLAPLGATGDYLSLGKGGVATVALHGTTSYSFLWGSPDAHNFIDVATSDGSVSFGGNDFAALLGVTANGSNAHTGLLTITAAAGVTIDSIRFRSGGIAFELAEAESAVTAVPEVQTSSLMMLGLAALGCIARRRRAG